MVMKELTPSFFASFFVTPSFFIVFVPGSLLVQVSVGRLPGLISLDIRLYIQLIQTKTPLP